MKNYLTLSFLFMFLSIVDLSAQTSNIEDILNQDIILKECALEANQEEATKCTEEKLMELISEAMKDYEFDNKKFIYHIEFSLYSNGEFKVGKVIKIPQDAEIHAEKEIELISKEVVKNLEWLPLKEQNEMGKYGVKKYLAFDPKSI